MAVSQQYFADLSQRYFSFDVNSLNAEQRSALERIYALIKDCIPTTATVTANHTPATAIVTANHTPATAIVTANHTPAIATVTDNYTLIMAIAAVVVVVLVLAILAIVLIANHNSHRGSYTLRHASDELVIDTTYPNQGDSSHITTHGLVDSKLTRPNSDGRVSTVPDISHGLSTGHVEHSDPDKVEIHDNFDIPRPTVSLSSIQSPRTYTSEPIPGPAAPTENLAGSHSSQPFGSHESLGLERSTLHSSVDSHRVWPAGRLRSASVGGSLSEHTSSDPWQLRKEAGKPQRDNEPSVSPSPELKRPEELTGSTGSSEPYFSRGSRGSQDTIIEKPLNSSRDSKLSLDLSSTSQPSDPSSLVVTQHSETPSEQAGPKDDVTKSTADRSLSTQESTGAPEQQATLTKYSTKKTYPKVDVSQRAPLVEFDGDGDIQLVSHQEQTDSSESMSGDKTTSTGGLKRPGESSSSRGFAP
ncbi:hypothetical protein NEHOM01_0462 [Nematocida homosporus]|uniref:uncharacterized protein n=1 Tax=Nematocida homosporus TaxID=1912981 RepID=UPI0022210CC2|nr:uncharacterized protein NEHOM01_0462 [Nematocida homosporus]KAI5184911.1 hypothetical protein NEHOM01_0462 [Nematocida homosporus]